MGRPGDVDQLREVLALLKKEGLLAHRVRVGGIELALYPPLLQATPSAGDDTGEAHLIEKVDPDEEARLKAEYEESTMYGASEGVDMGMHS